MKAAVVGGKLQGVEAAYLGLKAGWDVTVIDRKADVPASGMAHKVLQADIVAHDRLERLLSSFDLIIPALENQSALGRLKTCARQCPVPILFDFDAYAVTCSKSASNRLLADLGIPTPATHPECGFPVVAKPSHGSGSRGVRVIHDSHQLQTHLAKTPEEQVVQQFVDGPAYSLEIVGQPGRYQPLQVTALQMDPGFDCKRVKAPGGLPRHLTLDFNTIALTIAKALKLNGLMDIEVVLDGEVLRVLEIDARLPSQTPTAVLGSTDVNMLSLLASQQGLGPPAGEVHCTDRRAVIYEHIRVGNGRLSVTGEHAMGQAGPLNLEKDFFGADEALTSQYRNRSEWVATLIVSDADEAGAWEKRQAVIADIMRHFKLVTCLDPGPDACHADPQIC